MASPQNEDVPPPNDMFSAAEQISGVNKIVDGTTLNATTEIGEPLVYEGQQTVWYRWVAPADLSMTFEAHGLSGSDAPGIAVYSGMSIVKLFSLGSGSHFDRVTFIASKDTEYAIQVSAKYFESAGPFRIWCEINGAESWKQFDFDGVDRPGPSPEVPYTTGKSDFAIYRWWTFSQPTAQVWVWLSNSQTARVFNFPNHLWGSVNIMAGDYDADGLVDIAAYQQATGTLWAYSERLNRVESIQWGLTGDVPVQGDFDGDDVADPAVWRPSTGTFWVRSSISREPIALQWGMSGDKPVCADYDGDGRTDFAVRRDFGNDTNTVYYLLRSSDQQLQIIAFGYADDLTVPGDYDADGKNDLAVFRPGNRFFYYIRSSDGQARIVEVSVPFIDGDRVVPGDYFDAPASDLCVWRYQTGTYYCLADGGTGPMYTYKFGLQGDQPVASSNVH